MASQTFGQALGSLIYRKRKAAGLTQMQLAEDAYGSSGRTRRISELESGIVANPHPKTIDPIIVALQISDSEVEECARSIASRPESDLDRAYREARNLIDAIAKQFEHSKPSATLAELDQFLRSKAAEWASLRARLMAIEVPQKELLGLREQAAGALSEGDFVRVDSLLSEAEENYHKSQTLEEVSRFSEIRLIRGDSSMFSGKPEGALELYLSAAEFFRPFDERKTAECLNKTAWKAYEIERRSLDPALFVPARLLERLLELPSVKNNPEEIAAANYRLGLIYRTEFDMSPHRDDLTSLDKAILHSQLGMSFLSRQGATFESISASIGLANCLGQRGRLRGDSTDLSSAVTLLKTARSTADSVDGAAELLPHIYNNLGNSLLGLGEVEHSQGYLDEALEAFSAGVKESERFSNAEGWGAAKINIGALLSDRAQDEELESHVRRFLRVRAISEFHAALEIFPESMFPTQYAQAHLRLGDVLREHALSSEEGLVEFYLFRAIQSYEAAATVVTKERDPRRWAHIQIQLGSIFAFHAKLEGVDTSADDYERATERYKTALAILRDISEEEHAVDWCVGALERAQIALRELNGKK